MKNDTAAFTILDMENIAGRRRGIQGMPDPGAGQVFGKQDRIVMDAALFTKWDDQLYIHDRLLSFPGPWS